MTHAMLAASTTLVAKLGCFWRAWQTKYFEALPSRC
jgi:hypothetical protein